MTVLALDVGDRRIGVAVSDPTELLARPLTVLTRRSNLQSAEAIARLVQEADARLIVVGLPLASDEEIGEQARKTLAFARFLKTKVPSEIVTWDERLSTRDAQEEMIAQGVRRTRRRGLLDAAAAAVILDDWLRSQVRRPE